MFNYQHTLNYLIIKNQNNNLTLHTLKEIIMSSKGYNGKKIKFKGKGKSLLNMITKTTIKNKTIRRTNIGSVVTCSK